MTSLNRTQPSGDWTARLQEMVEDRIGYLERRVSNQKAAMAEADWVLCRLLEYLDATDEMGDWLQFVCFSKDHKLYDEIWSLRSKLR